MLIKGFVARTSTGGGAGTTGKTRGGDDYNLGTTQDLEGVDHVSRPHVPPGVPLNRALLVKFTREFNVFR